VDFRVEMKMLLCMSYVYEDATDNIIWQYFGIVSRVFDFLNPLFAHKLISAAAILDLSCATSVNGSKSL